MIKAPANKKGKGIRIIAPAELYMVQYEDGVGRAQSRLVARVETGSGYQVFILRDQIAGSPVATEAHRWFGEELNSMLAGNESGEVNSI